MRAHQPQKAVKRPAGPKYRDSRSSLCLIPLIGDPAYTVPGEWDGICTRSSVSPRAPRHRDAGSTCSKHSTCADSHVPHRSPCLSFAPLGERGSHHDCCLILLCASAILLGKRIRADAFHLGLMESFHMLWDISFRASEGFYIQYWYKIRPCQFAKADHGYED